MNMKPKRFSFGAIVICTFALVTFHSGICGPVDVTGTTEHSLKHDFTATKRQAFDSRLWQGDSNIKNKFMTPGEPSESGLFMDQYQTNPTSNVDSKCKEGEIKYVVQGRFEFTSEASTMHSSTDSDSQSGARAALQPVVDCAETSFTLTVSRKWAAQLQIRTSAGNVLSFAQLSPECGYYIHKSWKDISITALYNGCHVQQEGDRYVLPLLWRRSQVQVSCPVSPIKSQAFDGLSVCCSPFGLTVGIQGPSTENQLSVKVRGEWTPLLELVQHCGYRLDSRNAEIRIAAPFLACGITTRDGNYTLSLQIGKEEFILTCSTSKSPQQQLPQQTPSITPRPKTSNPLKRAAPFYLAPPHYPLPKHRHKTRVYPNSLPTPSTTSFTVQQLETPQQDEQQNKPLPYHRVQTTLRGSVRVLPNPKPSPSPQAKQTSPTSLPHNYAFNPYYLFYHSPKIPLTNQRPLPGSVVSDPPKPDAPVSRSSSFDPDVSRTNFGVFQNPMRSTHSSPLPAFTAQIQRGRVWNTNDWRNDEVWPGKVHKRDFSQVTASVKIIPPSTEQPLPYGSKRKQMYHPLPYPLKPLYQGLHGLRGKNVFTAGSFSLPKEMPSSIPQRENPQDGAGKWTPDYIQTSSDSGSLQNLYQFFDLYSGPQVKNVLPAGTFLFPKQAPSFIPPKENLQANFGAWFPQNQFYHLFHRLQDKGFPTPAPSREKTPDPIPFRENPHNSFASYSPPDSSQLYHLYNFYYGQQDNDEPPQTSLSLQQPPKPPPPFEVQQNGFRSFFQPELPVPFEQGIDPAVGLNNEGESAAHSDPAYDIASWEKWFNMVQLPHIFPPPFPLPEEQTQEDENVRGLGVVGTQPSTSPCTPGTGSRFHRSVPARCFTFAVKECVVGDYFVFSLPEFVVEPKVVGPASSEEVCALQRPTSNPHLYFVPLQGCGVTKQVIDALTIYQLELETCDTGSFVIRILVECSLYPGLAPAETLLILDPIPLQQLASVQLRIATDESLSFHPEPHLPLSRLRGRPLLMELSLQPPPDPSVRLWVHFCLAYTLGPHSSTKLLYDGCAPESESQRLPSPSNVQFIEVSSFLSLTSPNPSFVSDVDPEVFFFCLTEACSASVGACSPGCINSSEQK